LKSIVRLIIALAIIAGGIWLWLWLFPSPQKVITERLQKLAGKISIHAGEGYLPRMANAQSAGNYFATSVEINIDVPHYKEHRTLTRDEIVQAIMGANLSGGLNVNFPDIDVTVSADKQSAQAVVTLQARIPGESDMVIQPIKFTLQKIDGKWVIIKAQTVRPLS
jgi:hypothetical protein